MAKNAQEQMLQRRVINIWSAGLFSLFVLLYTARLVFHARRQNEAENNLQESYERLTRAHEELTAADEELRAQYDEALKGNEQILKQNLFLSTLHETALGLMNRLDSREVLKAIVTSAAALTVTEHASIVVVDESSQTAERMVGIGLYSAMAGNKVNLNDGLLGEAYRQKRTIVVDDYSTLPNRRREPAYSLIHANVHVPLIVGERMIGSLGVSFTDEKRRFTESDVTLIEHFAELAAIALENAYLYTSLASAEEDIRSQYEKIIKVNAQIVSQNTVLSTLHETTLGLMNRLDIDEVLKTIVQRAADLAGTDSAYLMLLNREEGYFERKIAIGNYDQDIGGIVKIDQGLVGEVYRLERTVIIPDYKTWEKRVRNPLFDAICTNMHVPLRFGNEIAGTIGFAYVTPDRSFTPEMVEFLEQFARIASIALENATLHTNLRKQLDEKTRLEKQKEAILEAIPDLMAVFDQNGIFLDYRATPSFVSSVEVASKVGSVLGSSLTELLPPDIAQKFLHNIRESLLTGKHQICEYTIEIAGVNRYREARFVKVEENEVLSMERDITDSRHIKERVEFLSIHDHLTGAYNRAFFEDESLRLLSKKAMNIGVFVCDVDGLKLINDTLGHHQGDEILKRVITILQENLAPPDFVARIGGDEFAVVILNSSKMIMEKVEMQFKKAIAESNESNPLLPLSMSIGWAIAADGLNLDKVFKDADYSMYRQKMHQSHSVRGSIVQTMMKALEVKDGITEGHSVRLGDLMENMGKKLEMPQGMLADLKLFAKFHDIGKVGIPDDILKKPGKLEENEMAIMRRHCEIGYRIASASPDLMPIADWILKHQEHWDGTGYPLGIVGEGIPIQCRILGIVDAYDAMTRDRPYRNAMSHEDAISEIIRCAGTQFDPELTRLFIELYG